MLSTYSQYSSSKFYSQIALKKQNNLSYTMADTEEILKRINQKKGIAGTVIINSEGHPVHSTLDNASTIHYSHHMHVLVTKACKAVREIDPEDGLDSLRINTKKSDILIAPAEDGSALIVVQNRVQGPV